jgi:hypothetical protein
VQLIARDEPNTNPKPLATLQVSVPTTTPGCACAEPVSARAGPSAAINVAASQYVLNIEKPPCAALIHELEISARLRQRLTRCGAQLEKSCQPKRVL